MIEVSAATTKLRGVVAKHEAEMRNLFLKYKATNPRLFESVARGDARAESDIDILVDMDATDGNILLRASGLLEEAQGVLGIPVDIFPIQLLKTRVSDAALREAIAL